MTDHRLQQDSDRGRLAQQVLDNPIYQEALIIMRGELMNAFEQSKFCDQKGRDEVWRKYQVIGWLENHMQRVMQTGQRADKSLVEKVKSRFVR